MVKQDVSVAFGQIWIFESNSIEQVSEDQFMLISDQTDIERAIECYFYPIASFPLKITLIGAHGDKFCSLDKFLDWTHKL